MTQLSFESTNAAILTLDSSIGARLGEEVACQASVSRSRCAKPLPALSLFASVDFPEPELPNTNIFLKAGNLVKHNSLLVGAQDPTSGF